MTGFKNSPLWTSAFTSESLQDQQSIQRLIEVFDRTRENAATIVSEIAIEFPTFTVHDINHLDALWEIGSQVTGPDFPLNPVEGFILGCSFLLHDAAMSLSAYPGGVNEIKQSHEWQRLSSKLIAVNGADFDEASALEIFLREQHANRAEELPRTAWNGDQGSYYLIDDAEIREKFGVFIGIVSASHWWDYQKLENELRDRIIPAPSPFPSQWSIDLLKLACILRTSDAAQIDETRAPGFLRALRRNRLSDISSQHWTFQNKLTQAQNRADSLYFAALRPFTKNEANEWWMLHDTLKMVDVELRKSDSILSRLRSNEFRLASRKVANLESTDSLRSAIPTTGWIPIDTSFSIPDIPELVKKLGGDQLYGDEPFSAVRELVQNGMDATRVRTAVDPNAPPPLIDIQHTDEDSKVFLTIRDNGVGMSMDEITDNLLSFGGSGWLTNKSVGEYNNNYLDQSNVSGKFGIGFFSVFMLGKKILLKTRRFDLNPDETYFLEFTNGTNERPLLFKSEYSDRMTSGGTEIKIELNHQELSKSGIRSGFSEAFWKRGEKGLEALLECLSLNFPACDVPIRIQGSGCTNLLDSRKWETESSTELLSRVEGPAYNPEFEEKLQIIREPSGEVVGRACLIPSSYSRMRMHSRFSIEGSIVSKGARIATGWFRGIVLGVPTRASRDAASLSVSEDALRNWANEQALAWEDLAEDDSIAEAVAGLGGEIGQLKFCEVGGNYLNKAEVRKLLEGKDSIWVAHDAGVSLSRPKGIFSERTDNCVSVGMGITNVFRAKYNTKVRKTLEDILIDIIAGEFKIDDEVISQLQEIRPDGATHTFMGDAPVWKLEDGSFIFERGHYYKRSMKLSDIETFHART